MPSRESVVNRYVRQYKERKENRSRRKKVLLPFKVAFGVIFSVVAAYFIIQIYGALRSPFITTPAAETSINTGFSIVGYFVRSESVVSADNANGIVVYNVNDGDKLGRYDTYASVYTNTSTADLKNRILTYTERKEVLESALLVADNSSAISRLSDEVYDDLGNVAALAGSCDFSLMTDLVDELKTDVIVRELVGTDSAEIESLIELLDTRITGLSHQIGSSEISLTVPHSGYFSSHVDGYETLFNTSSLDELTPLTLDAITAQPKQVQRNQVGKVVTNFKGWFVSNINVNDASSLKTGHTVKMRLDVLGNEYLDMKIESISKPENGEVTIVFSYDKHLQELINLRRQSAVLVLDNFSGLKVPREAVRVDSEGNNGVYVITGLYAEFKKIDILYETDDYYIVESDPSTTTSLLKDDTIIVSGKNLSNGKVVD